MDPTLIILGAGTLIFLALVFSVIFRRYQIPDVLFLFAIGLLLGPVTGIIRIDDFDTLGSTFAIITLVIILFEAGLDIQIKSILSLFWKANLLMLTTLLGTVAVVAPLAIILFDVSLLVSILSGIIVGSVSSGIGLPIIARLNVRDETKALLTLESNLNNVVTIVLILFLARVLQQESISLAAAGWEIIRGFAYAVIVGVLFAVTWSRILGRIRGITNSMFTTPALVLILYSITELLGGSGPVAALIFGIVLGHFTNSRPGILRTLLGMEAFRLTRHERRFFTGLVFLLQAFFFVYVGIAMDLSSTPFLLWGAGATFLLFVLRAVTVKYLFRTTLSPFDLAILKRLLPKGLVGLALISLIGDPIVRDITYPIILFSILYTSILIPLVRNRSVNPPVAAAR